MKIDENTPGFNKMQNVKRRFFALRNGVVADVYRNSNDPHRIVFGLSFVDLKQIAAVTGKDADLARLLYANTSTRESRLLAPMIMPDEYMTRTVAAEWLANVMSAEEADILCNTLLRRMDYASDVAKELYARTDATALQRYAALRMAAVLLVHNPDDALVMAKAELSMPYTAMTNSLAKMIVEEINYLSKHN